MSKTITAHIGDPDRTLKKSQRYFSASLRDILVELLQNSRRAHQAKKRSAPAWETRVKITVGKTPEGQPTLTVEDTAGGLQDPENLLNFGTSGWDEATETSEDPAGAGFFSLSARDWVDVSSLRWTTRLTPDVFKGDASAEVENGEAVMNGLRVTFPISTSELEHLEDKLDRLVKYYPLPVFLNGNELPRQDFLSNAVRIESFFGLRIGLMPGTIYYDIPNVNFYGLTLQNKDLPTITDPIHGHFYIAVDAAGSNDFKLVLPARKEVYQNDFWQQTQTEAWRVICRHFQQLGTHYLGYEEWEAAQAAGIDLPHGYPYWSDFEPGMDWEDRHFVAAPVPEGAVINATDASFLDVVGAEALEQWKLILVKPEHMEYRWARKLPKLTDLRTEIQIDGQIVPFEELGRENRWVDSITLIATVDGTEHRYPLKYYVYNSDSESEYDCWPTCLPWDVKALVVKGTDVNVHDLAALATDALFYASEESDEDSEETQRKDFAVECISEFGTAFLSSTEEALKAQWKALLGSLYLSIPEGYSADIQVFNRGKGTDWDVKISSLALA